MVEQWLKLVKAQATTAPAQQTESLDPSVNQMQLLDDSLAMGNDELGGLGGSLDIDVDEIIPTLSSNSQDTQPMDVIVEEQQEVVAVAQEESSSSPKKEDNLKIKISMRDGKTKVTSSGSGEEGKTKSSSSSSSSRSERKGSSDKERSSSSSSRTERKGKSSSSSSSSGHKSSSTSSSSSSSKRSSSSSKSSSSSRDKDRERSRGHSSSKSSSSSSSSSSSKPEVSQADKDKDTLSKVMGGQSVLDKLGKIPKRPRTEEGTTTAKKAASFSIEGPRKDQDNNRPKTVKTFNSQFRDHGLVEDIPPPPSRKAALQKKSAESVSPAAIAVGGGSNKSTTTTTTTNALKRASPVKEVVSPTVSEKRLKLEQLVASSGAGGAAEEKPGGVKLIAPRSKRKYWTLTLYLTNGWVGVLCVLVAGDGDKQTREDAFRGDFLVVFCDVVLIGRVVGLALFVKHR